MQNTDIPAVLVVQSLLLLFFLVALVRDTRIRKAEKSASVGAEVTRGDKSMNALYTAYGASVASSLVLVTNAEGLEGHKVLLIVVPFFCLTYLFFFSTWFRNSIFFPLAQRLRKD